MKALKQHGPFISIVIALFFAIIAISQRIAPLSNVFFMAILFSGFAFQLRPKGQVSG